MRAALEPLPWVEHSSIDVYVSIHRVGFDLKDKAQFDLEVLKKALANAGFPGVTMVRGPEAKAPRENQ